jgi:TetR/AcrR family transcriptional regulator, ethionamide resistance regulator
MMRPVSTSAQRLRNREQREATRREILAASERFLRASPHRELSVEVVMAQTGLTRTAFYRHFDDVTDLMLRLLAELGQELFAIAERWEHRADGERQTAAREELKEIVDFFVRHGPLVQAISEAAATDEQIERAYRAALDSFVEKTKEVLERRVEGGMLAVPDTRAVALALNLMNESFLLHEFGRDRRGDPAVALATLETIWLRVAGAGAGTESTEES